MILFLLLRKGLRKSWCMTACTKFPNYEAAKELVKAIRRRLLQPIRRAERSITGWKPRIKLCSWNQSVPLWRLYSKSSNFESCVLWHADLDCLPQQAEREAYWTKLVSICWFSLCNMKPVLTGFIVFTKHGRKDIDYWSVTVTPRPLLTEESAVLYPSGDRIYCPKLDRKLYTVCPALKTSLW